MLGADCAARTLIDRRAGAKPARPGEGNVRPVAWSRPMLVSRTCTWPEMAGAEGRLSKPREGLERNDEAKRDG